MTERTELKGLVFIALTAVMWSTGGLLIKLVPWGALSINGARSAIAAVVLLIYMRRIRIKINFAVILAALSVSATNNLFVFANKLTTASNAIVLQYTAPLFVLIFTVLFYKKRPSLLQTGLVVTAFLGIILTFLDGIGTGKMTGNLLALLSGVTFAGIFFANRLPGASAVDASLLACLINVVISLPFVGGEAALDSTQIFAVVALGVLQIGLAYIFFSIGIRHTTSLAASLICLLEALLNPIWVFLFMGERPSSWAILGGGVVLVCIIVNTIYESRRLANETSSGA